MSNKSVPETAGVSDRPRKTIVREYAEAIVIAIVLALVIRTFVIQAFKIPSGSMEDTLLIGDHLLVSKFSYGTHIPNEIPFFGNQLFPDFVLFQEIPKRGDIIVFKYPLDESRDFIKRVIGLPGETLEVRRQKVYINEKPLNEPYVQHTVPYDPVSPVPNRDDYGPIRVPEGHVFVMGDNRENSSDGRMWGFLDVSKIRGKAQRIYWSWNSDEFGIRWDRLGQSVYE